MEILFKTGSLFNSKAEILINPVNTRGVMGAGLAKQFKSKFKGNFEKYVEHCNKVKEFKRFGAPVFEDSGKLICNFPTKDDWKDNSQLSYIRRGLIALRSFLEDYPYRYDIKRIAIPALGCGLGGLSQIQVLHLILYHLKFVDLDITIELYGFDQVPKKIKAHMSKRYILSHRQYPRYTGVGSRDTTVEAECDISTVAIALSKQDYLLVTGDATRGGDKIFWEYSPTGQKRRFGPYGRKYYSDHTEVVPPESEYYRLAVKIASSAHPAWRFLQDFHKELHTRNAFQVLGNQLGQPAEFLVCWTPDGAEEKTTRKTGGTGTAIRIAIMFGIPVFNLANKDSISRLGEFLGLDLYELAS